MPLYSLGLIKVPTAGTPVMVSSVHLDVNGVYFSVVPGMVGNNVYIGTKGLLKTPPYTNVLKILQKPGPSTAGIYEWTAQDQGSIAAIDLINLYVDADTSGDGVLVGYLI